MEFVTLKKSEARHHPSFLKAIFYNKKWLSISFCRCNRNRYIFVKLYSALHESMSFSGFHFVLLDKYEN